jgi:predicted MFS family arabinose efflux permease
MVVAAITFPVFSLGPALTTRAWLLGIVFFVGGAFSVGWNVVTVSLRQRIVPDEILGRVNAGYRLVAWGTMPLGAALGGLVATAYGVTATFWVSAALSALCFPLVALGTTRAQIGARAERGGQPEPAGSVGVAPAVQASTPRRHRSDGRGDPAREGRRS